jgi:hypothetical protein
MPDPLTKILAKKICQVLILSILGEARPKLTSDIAAYHGPGKPDNG